MWTVLDEGDAKVTDFFGDVCGEEKDDWTEEADDVFFSAEARGFGRLDILEAEIRDTEGTLL